MKSLNQIVNDIINSESVTNIQPNTKSSLYDDVCNNIVNQLHEQIGYRCYNPYQKGNSSERNIEIIDNNRNKIILRLEVKVEKHGNVKYSYTSAMYYKVKSIKLLTYSCNVDKPIDEIFAEIFAEIENEKLEIKKQEANQFPEIVEEFNSFVLGIKEKMSNKENIDSWDIKRKIEEIIEKYNDSIEALKTLEK